MNVLKSLSRRGRGVILLLAVGLTTFPLPSTAAEFDLGWEVLTGQAYQWSPDGMVSRGPWSVGTGISCKVASFTINLDMLEKPREIIVKAIAFGAFRLRGSDAGIEDAAKQSLSGPQAGGGVGLETTSDQSIMLLYSRLFSEPWRYATGHALIVAYGFEFMGL